MADESDRQQRASARTRLILFSCLFAGFAAAGAVIARSQSWADLFVAFLLVTVAGPGAGLAIDAATDVERWAKVTGRVKRPVTQEAEN